MKGKTSKAMGAKGKLGMAVMSKVKSGEYSYGKGVSAYGGVPMLLTGSFYFSQAHHPHHLKQVEH